jgi:hypothetical protein
VIAKGRVLQYRSEVLLDYDSRKDVSAFRASPEARVDFGKDAKFSPYSTDLLDLTGCALCIGGFDSTPDGINVHPFSDPVSNVSQQCVALDDRFTMDTFSIAFATSETKSLSPEQCLMDVERAISVDDALNLGLDKLPVDFDDYFLFIVPSAVVADPAIYNQCKLITDYSLHTTITPTERENGVIRSIAELSDVVDTTVLSHRQNTNHAILVIGDTTYMALSSRELAWDVPLPIVIYYSHTL